MKFDFGVYKSNRWAIGFLAFAVLVSAYVLIVLAVYVAVQTAWWVITHA